MILQPITSVIRKKGKSLAGIFFLLCMTAHNLMAADVNLPKGQVDIDASSIAYDKEQDTFHAKGDVIITFSQGFLMADSVIMNRKNNDAFAEGNVMIMSDGNLLEGDKVKFDIGTKTGVIYGGNMFFEETHFYIKGSKIVKKRQETYRIEDATATTCDGDFPAWRIAGKSLDVTVDGYGSIKQGKFFIKNCPVLYFPYMVFPAKTTRQSGLLFPQFSYSQNKLGIDIELPFYLAISDNTDATFYQRYMDKRGFKEGVEFRYLVGKDTFGTFYGDFMNDTGPSADSQDGIDRKWQSAQKRWSLYLNHETAFSPSFYLRTDIKKVSDRWYFKDFNEHNYYRDHYSANGSQRFQKVAFYGDESLSSLESTVRLVKNWSLYNLTALISETNDFAGASNSTTLQKYPEITLTGLKQPLFGTSLNLEFSSTYDYYYRDEGQRGHLYDLQPVLSLPLNAGDYLQITPMGSVKETYWSRDDKAYTSQSKQANRVAFNTGVDIKTEAHRIFHIGGQRIDKFRHSIQPEINYRYIPNVNQDETPDFVAKIPEQSTVTYALTNTLVAKFKEKAGGKRYKEVLRFKLSQTYDIVESTRNDLIPFREKRPFSDVGMELDINPIPYVLLSARNKYDVYSNAWNQSNYDLNISDWRGDWASVGYRYTRYVLDGINPFGSFVPFSSYRYSQSALEEINLSLKAVITKSLDVMYVLRRNELDKKTLESSLNFNYHKQCWGVDIKYSETDTDRSFMVMFSLYGLGQIGSSASTGRR